MLLERKMDCLTSGRISYPPKDKKSDKNRIKKTSRMQQGCLISDILYGSPLLVVTTTGRALVVRCELNLLPKQISWLRDALENAVISFQLNT